MSSLWQNSQNSCHSSRPHKRLISLGFIIIVHKVLGRNLRTYFSNLDIFLVVDYLGYYVKCPYLSPNNCDPRDENEKLNAKRTFDFLVKEYFKLINFGRIYLVTSDQNCFRFDFYCSSDVQLLGRRFFRSILQSVES